MEHGRFLNYGPWSIEADLKEVHDKTFLQSIFFQGNGEYGLRATMMGDVVTPTNHGVYKAGCFEYLKQGITDMVNLPDPMLMSLSLDGKHITGAPCIQRLDMQRGLLTRSWHLEEGVIEYERVVSFTSIHTVAHRLKVLAKKPMQIDLSDQIDRSVMNLPIHDDQTMENDLPIPMLDSFSSIIEGSLQHFCFQSVHGSFSFSWFKKYSSSHPFTHDERGFLSHLLLKEGESFFGESVVSLDGNPDAFSSFEQIAQETQAYLIQFWDLHDITIGGTVAEQSAIRYAIYTLHQNAVQNDLSIGARGLSHARYKGCYFWDSEVFLLPYYLYTDPQVAGRLLSYRVDKFAAAKAYATSLNHKGARYPWMSSLDGTEQCESWDTGKCELHVSADIAWAMDLYQEACKNIPSFNPIIVEIARFYASRFSYVKQQDSYEMFFVKGPNEYGGVTKNNTFTTMMALHTIKLALRSGELLEASDYQIFNDILAKAKVPYSKELGTYLEDDLFLSLEPFDLSAHKQGEEALYHTISYDRLQRYQVIKQPDVLLLYLMLPKLFTDDEARNAWNVYEKLTSHDSTLSWGMHSYAAYKLDLRDEAYAYLSKAMFLDLENRMGNTSSEGLHVGAMGAFLQALLFGSAGISCEKGLVSVNPRLPESWSFLSCSITYRGERYRIKITDKSSVIQKISLTNE
mgnify:CR=1 FL=1